MNVKHHFQILLKFFSIGAIATLVHGVVFSLLIALQISAPQLANFFAYILALTVSYFGQRYWTFSKSKSNNSFNAILRFICVSFLGYALNAVWVYTATKALGLSPYYALLGIGLLTPAMTFLLLKFWVFNEDKNTEPTLGN